MSDAATFTRISTAAIRVMIKAEVASLDVYLPYARNGEPVLYRGFDSQLSAPDFQRLQDHGVDHVFVRSGDLRHCQQAIESKLGKILGDPLIAPEDKALLLNAAGTVAAHSVVASGVSPESISRSAVIVDHVISCVLTNPSVTAHILHMAGHEQSTASHMQIVSTLGVMLGAAVFGDDQEALKALGFAGMLHDLGKLSIPCAVLNKTEPLTREESALLQQHPIESIRLIGNDPTVCAEARRIILQHHERVDGRGYPVGLCGGDLLAGSRVLAVVDAFHAMVGPRPYRTDLSIGAANHAMALQAKRQFDPDILSQWLQVCERYRIDEERRTAEATAEPGQTISRYEGATRWRCQQVSVKRPPRRKCPPGTVVRCIYAGRLINATVTPNDFGSPVQDVSRGGMCINTAHPMYRGEIVHLRIPGPSGASWIGSMVAWCRQHEARRYCVGLQFIRRLAESEVSRCSAVRPMGGMDQEEAGVLEENDLALVDSR